LGFFLIERFDLSLNLRVSTLYSERDERLMLWIGCTDFGKGIPVMDGTMMEVSARMKVNDLVCSNTHKAIHDGTEVTIIKDILSPHFHLKHM